MKDCEKIRELFSEYIDGVLDKANTDLVEEHLSKCEACREELNKLIKMLGILKNLKKEDTPPDFLETLQERIRQRKALNTFLSKLLKSPNVKVPLIVCIIIIFVIAVFKTANIYYLPKTVSEKEYKLEDFKKRRSFSEKPAPQVSLKGGRLRKEERFLKKKEIIPSRKMFKGAEKEEISKHVLFEKVSEKYSLNIETEDVKKALKEIKKILQKLDIKIIYPSDIASLDEKVKESGFFELTINLSYEKFKSFIEELKKSKIGKITFPQQIPLNQPFSLHILLKKSQK